MRNDQNSTDIFIVGASGFAAELYSWIASSTNKKPAGFIVGDVGVVTAPVPGVKCYRECELIGASGLAYVAIGNPISRRRVVNQLKEKYCFEYPNFVHNTALVDQGALRGRGNLILPFSIVCPRAIIGSFNILNIYSSVAHDAGLGDFNTLSPYSTLNGNSQCENSCFLGTHATLGPGVHMDSSSSLSANSFCKKDMPEDSLAFGVPAKIVRAKSKK